MSDIEQPRILVVDDQANWQRALYAILCAAGYEVLLSGDLRSALEIASNTHLDLALVDMRLRDDSPTDVSGLKLLSFLRDHSPETPIVILTGYFTDYSTRFMEDYHVDEVLLKGSGFDIAEFMELIAQLLSRSSEGRDAENSNM